MANNKNIEQFSSTDSIGTYLYKMMPKSKAFIRSKFSSMSEMDVEEIFGNSHNHPYTKGLINCIPDLTSTAPRLHPIAGRMGDPRIKVQGCCFADRCPNATEKCKTTPPPMVYEGEHGILCHLYSKEGA